MFRLSQVSLMTVLTCGMLCSSVSMGQETEQTNDLTGRLLLTDRGDEFLHARRAGNMHELGIEWLKVVPRERFLTAIVVFAGCASNAEGNCDATVDYVAYNPEGDIYGDALTGVELWQDKPAVESGFYELSVEYMGLVIDSDDPAGQYRLEATLHDRISGSSETFVWPFLVR